MRPLDEDWSVVVELTRARSEKHPIALGDDKPVLEVVAFFESKHWLLLEILDWLAYFTVYVVVRIVVVVVVVVAVAVVLAELTVFEDWAFVGTKIAKIATDMRYIILVEINSILESEHNCCLGIVRKLVVCC